MITIHTIHIGQPQTITDETGAWQSSIFRKPLIGPVQLEIRGLEGDQVTDRKIHGSPDQAVCCHPLDHYHHWNAVYNTTTFGPGSIGENWTLMDADEQKIYIGDIYVVGTVQVQVSGPRMPCSKQNRKLHLPDFQKRTRQALRTGFYLRVLTPGIVTAGNGWQLQARPQPTISLHTVNVCAYHEFEPDVAQQLIKLPELAKAWRRFFQRKLNLHRPQP
ncbi:MAG: MOSC domain-containing protein [Chloroflexi bacterium]|nr:MOSC domain-containing protein [Chloroflexota bacterium]